MTARARCARAASALAVACVVSTIGACKETKPPPVALGGPADSAEQVLFGVRTLLTNKGVQKGELLADTMYTFNDQTRFDLRNARVNFNTDAGAPNGTMRANRGIYDTRTQILEGFGDVVITSVDGKRLTSPHLRFNQMVNEVSSDTTFELKSGDKTQKGIGFTADPQLNHFVCKRYCGGTAPIVIPSE
jgi:LPS export ABC transporter protein LptC